ncbi:MAG: transglutaminase domain-containing protein, partial [Bacillota bacterium]|nr:transglutaminase domain-containing protein [Bacillota bacterium]
MNKLYLKFIIISLFLGILILTAFPFLFLFAPQQGRDFYYRELTYKHIASTNVGNVKDKYEILLSLFNYVKGNQNVDPNYKSEDKTAYNNLVLGVSWCDQQAFLLATLLNEYGINSRFRDVQHHTTLEVYINNQWKLIDPFFGQLFYRKVDGQLATLNDIIDNNGANITVNNFESSKPYIKDMGNIIPSKLYIPSEVRWKNGIGPDFIQILSES